jgi:hypothetical protein
MGEGDRHGRLGRIRASLTGRTFARRCLEGVVSTLGVLRSAADNRGVSKLAGHRREVWPACHRIAGDCRGSLAPGTDDGPCRHRAWPGRGPERRAPCATSNECFATTRLNKGAGTQKGEQAARRSAHGTARPWSGFWRDAFSIGSLGGRLAAGGGSNAAALPRGRPPADGTRRRRRCPARCIC